MVPDVIEVVVFDIGGTIIQPCAWMIAEAVLDATGQAVALSTCLSAFARATAFFDHDDVRLDERDYVDGYVDVWVAALGLDRSHGPAAWAAVHERDRAEEPLWDHVEVDAVETLRLLARSRRLAALSNADGRLEAHLADLGLASFFETIVDSVVAGVQKPDPAAYLLVCAALGVHPSTCAYVGDKQSELVAAIHAGYGAAVHYDPFSLYDRGQFPVITALSELLAIDFAPVQR